MNLRMIKYLFNTTESIATSKLGSFLNDSKRKLKLTQQDLNTGRAWFTGVNTRNILILRVIKLFPMVILSIFKECIIK